MVLMQRKTPTKTWTMMTWSLSCCIEDSTPMNELLSTIRLKTLFSASEDREPSRNNLSLSKVPHLETFITSANSKIHSKKHTYAHLLYCHYKSNRLRDIKVVAKPFNHKTALCWALSLDRVICACHSEVNIPTMSLPQHTSVTANPCWIQYCKWWGKFMFNSGIVASVMFFVWYLKYFLPE